MPEAAATTVALRTSALASSIRRYAIPTEGMLLAVLVLMLSWTVAVLRNPSLTVRHMLTTWEVITCHVQSVLVWCLLTAFCLHWQRRRRSWWPSLVACNVVLLIHIVDLRCKLVFLQPLTWANAGFAVSHASSLVASANVFLGRTYWAGVLVSLLILNGFAFVFSRRTRRAAAACASTSATAGDAVSQNKAQVRVRAALLAAVALTLAAVASPQLPYQLNSSPFTVAIIRWLKRPFTSAPPVPIDFDQPLRTLEPPLPASVGDETAHSDRGSTIRRSVVLFVVESLRYEDPTKRADRSKMHIEDATPFLQSLARTGPIATRCYTQVPNSTKAMYSILTGRYAATSMEIVESQLDSIEGLVSAMNARGYYTAFVSTQFLHYQNIRRQYSAMGFDLILGAKDVISLARAVGYEPYVNGYGCDDGALLHGVVPRLPLDTPFLLVVYNCSTHHPYVYPGSSPDGPDRARYYRAMRYADSVLGKFARAVEMEAAPHVPLIVVVGDHGETFLYGNTRARGCGLLDSELVVPLIIADRADAARGNVEISYARQIDIAPTILNLTAVVAPNLSVQGQSLLTMDTSPAAYISSWGACDMLALVEGEAKYLWDVRGDRMWEFDLRTDPDNCHAKSVEPASKRQVARRLRAFAQYSNALLRKGDGG